MQAWGAWFGELGASPVDGGNQFGASVTISSDGAVSPWSDAAAIGYTIVTADSLSRPPPRPRAARTSPPEAASECTRPSRY